MVRNLKESPELKFLWPAYLYKNGNIVTDKLYKNNDRWTIGSYEDESFAYLLILIQTDKINEILKFDEIDKPLKLKSSTAYYPLIIPLHDFWQKLAPTDAVYNAMKK